MKRLLALSKLAMAAALVAFVSCQKENTDPEPEPDPIPEPPAFVCEHNNLEYVEAVKRTGKTAGNLAHWHCNNCNRNFLDAGTTKEIVNAYLPATNYCIDSEVLNRIQHIYPFVPASEQTKGEDGVIPTAVTLLHHKIQDYKFREFSKALFSELEEIQSQLNEIEAQIAQIQKQNTAILADLNDSDYAAAVAEIFNKGRFIWENSYTFFNYVVKYYTQFANDEIGQLQLRHLIKQTCLQWSYCSYKDESIYDLTTRAIRQFCCYDIDRSNRTYPQIFHHYNSDYRLWDHDGYTDRKQMDVESEAVLSLGYFMASLYRENAMDYALPDYRQEDSLKLSGYYDLIEPLVLNDIENMQKAKDAYRFFHNGTTKTFIEKSAIVVNGDYIINDDFGDIYWRDKSSVQDYYKKFHTRLDDKYKFGYSDGSTLTVEDYTAILNSYSNRNIFDVLHNDAQIDGMPAADQETRDVEGTKRRLYIRYYSNNDNTYSYSEDDCDKFSHGWAWKYLGLKYREFYFSSHNCGCTGGYHVTNIYAQEMTDKCKRGDNFGMEYNFRNQVFSENSVSNPRLCIRSKQDSWAPCSDAPVFLKKYTGTIFDPLD